MELRSSTKKRDNVDYEELKFAMTSMGIFEEGMQLQEMQDIMQAVQMSEAAATSMCYNSEACFQSNTPQMLHSTMIESAGKRELVSPPDSPEYHFEHFLVTAQVHHPMDWSPPPSTPNNDHEQLQNDSLIKRNKNAVAADQEQFHTASKRLRYDSIEDTAVIDSGINLSNSTTPTISPHSSKANSPKKLEINEDAFDHEKSTPEKVLGPYNKISAIATKSTAAEPITENFELLIVNELYGLPTHNLLQEEPLISGYHDENESWD